jgi:hypothetical protein
LYAERIAKNSIAGPDKLRYVRPKSVGVFEIADRGVVLLVMPWQAVGYVLFLFFITDVSHVSERVHNDTSSYMLDY